MPYIRLLLATLLGVLAISAEAGLVYHYSTRTTVFGQRDGGGRVWIDGDRKRVELDADPENPRGFDLAITAKGRTTYVNLQNKTYYNEPRTSSTSSPSPSLFHLPTLDDRIHGQPKISYQNAGTGPVVAGRETTKHVVQFRYQLRGDINGEPLRGDVAAVITVLTAPALPRLADRLGARTGFPEIDDELARLYASFEGMILRHEISVNRRIHGGPIINEFSVMSVDELKEEVKLEDSLFAIPSGLTYREPVIAAPGL